MVNYEDLGDTAELELVRTAELEQLTAGDHGDADELPIDSDEDPGFDPYNRA